ncbi:hypothetical protein [Kocuria sabuli]|uniref:hypothetical protein n=1 Tax=Kocuria sabuli TaxID=3071448 RepID=UPI0034D5B5F8
MGGGESTTTVVLAADSTFTPARKDAFVAARAGTRRIDLSPGTHDGHLDALEEWITVLREALRSTS